MKALRVAAATSCTAWIAHCRSVALRCGESFMQAEAGACAVVLEMVPDRVAAAVTEALRPYGVPTIGIGAGAGPRHVRCCRDLFFVLHVLHVFRPSIRVSSREQREVRHPCSDIRQPLHTHHC